MRWLTLFVKTNINAAFIIHWRVLGIFVGGGEGSCGFFNLPCFAATFSWETIICIHNDSHGLDFHSSCLLLLLFSIDFKGNLNDWLTLDD